MGRLAAIVAVVMVAVAPAPRLDRGARIAAPLADPAALPGIGRCTSDGACTVTDEAGTRATSPLRLFPAGGAVAAR